MISKVKKNILFSALFFIVLGGCAQMHDAQWQYVEKLPIVRSGNSYILKYGEKLSEVLKISSDFHYAGKEDNEVLTFDVFNKGETASILVVDRFGVFKDRLTWHDSVENYVVDKENDGSFQYITMVRDEGKYGAIALSTLLSHGSIGMWINMATIYVELLPHYNKFETWSPDVIDKRKKFIDDFKKRGKKAILFKLDTK